MKLVKKCHLFLVDFLVVDLAMAMAFQTSNGALCHDLPLMQVNKGLKKGASQIGVLPYASYISKI